MESLLEQSTIQYSAPISVAASAAASFGSYWTPYARAKQQEPLLALFYFYEVFSPTQLIMYPFGVFECYKTCYKTSVFIFPARVAHFFAWTPTILYLNKGDLPPEVIAQP